MPRSISPYRGKLLTQERLKEKLRYDPESGQFYWLKTNRAYAWVGRRAGRAAKDGYVKVSIDGTIYKAHRLAWFYMTGKWPREQIDHRDMDRSNNAWENLREATNRQNTFNRRSQSNNSSGLKGVTKKRPGQWFARCGRGPASYLGAFDCPAAAHFAYIIGASKIAGEFARFS